MLDAFISGFALSAALIIAIGAQNAFVLRQGLRREHVGPIVAFCALADFSLIAAGTAGLGAALERLPHLAGALTLGGAAFLTWYGLSALRRALGPSSLETRADAAPMTLAAALAQTAAFTLLNPHVYLDTLLLVGTIGAAQPPGGALPFVFGAGLASAGWFTALGYGARRLAPLFARPAAWRWLDALVGLTMLALAASLAFRLLA
ncbi:LysE family transporter [Acetobacteraceae bacterium H6797]|nr:LysE family transporter [Acetobacteraceae bacterium H6797]